MNFAPLGDSAITISISGERRADSIEILQRAWAIKQAIDQAKIPGIIETVSSYETVSVFTDPLVPLAEGVPLEQVTEWFEKQLRSAASKAGKKLGLTKSQEKEIPVCFEEEFALDLADIAATLGIVAEDVIARFCGARYQVACVGFAGGFPYLLGLPAGLAVARKATPRKVVPAGSVGIGGKQAGIYPVSSPGGWNIIGRTPVRLFDPSKEAPSLVMTGDRVRFKRISRAEFDSYGHAVRSGS